MKRLFAALFAVLMLLPVAAQAQEKTGAREGFTLAPGTARILLLRPAIRVGAQSTGGMFEPNADWTQQARDNLGAALAAAQRTLGNQVIELPEPVGADAERLAEYQALFSTLAESVITYQFFPGNRLPTKKRDKSFDWTMGPEVASIARESGCDYALFLWTDDQFGSTGRKVLQVFAALARVPVQSGVHKGYAGLVDLKTGHLVWLNADMAMGGDVRTPDGAAKRVGQLLEGFPGRTADAAPVVTAAKD